MHSVKMAFGIAGIGLVALAAPTFAAWTNPLQVTSGNLSHPSMVADKNNVQSMVARGDSGIWFMTNKSGSWVRTRLTQDSDSHSNGKLIHHTAWSPLIAVDSSGKLTVVYTVGAVVDGAGGGCGSPDTASIRYIVSQSGGWSKPHKIPGTTCQSATGIIAKGGTISLATIKHANGDASDIAFVTNTSGSWTHVTVANGLASHTAISPASLATYDGKPMLAYLRTGRVVYARGLSAIGNFTYETAAHAQSDELIEPSLAIQHGQPMIAWAQADGTHYAYRNTHGWYADRVMRGRTRAVLTFDSDGNAFIASADYYGGLWIGNRNSDGTWSTEQPDTHLVSDIGGIAIDRDVVVEIAYSRGEGTSHLYSVSSVTAC